MPELDSIGTIPGFGPELFQWESDRQPGSGSSLAAQLAAEHFDPLTHAAESIALFLKATATIIFNLQAARTVLLIQMQAANMRLGMANHISDGFPHRHRQHALLQGG